MPHAPTPEILHARWLHSHEEDTGTGMVFRPASFKFPPSRGRVGFELRPDQSLVEIGIAPADGPQETTGRWELQSGNQLSFFQRSSRKPSRTLHIVSVDKTRLIVKKWIRSRKGLVPIDTRRRPLAVAAVGCGHRIVMDAALRDRFWRPPGFWEAKDIHDDPRMEAGR